MCGRRFAALVVIAYSIYGQSLTPRRNSQQLYAIYSDASISNISLVSFGEEIIQPSQSITIPLSCYEPLQCGIPPQQNGSSIIYIPSEEHSSLILLELEGNNLYSYNITTHCVFSDFVLQPDVQNLPLLITCELQDGLIRYVLSSPYGNETRAGVESVPVPHPTQDQAVVNPIILEIPDEDVGGDIISLVSINAQNQIIVYDVQGYESRTYPLGVDQACIPLHIQKLRADLVFLLTCQNDHSYLVNISALPNVRLVEISNPVTALANSVRYSLSLMMANSTVSIRELVLSRPAGIRYIQLNTPMVVGGGFGPDDKFAYVATNREVTFIDVMMGFEGVEQFTHTISIPACSQCPPVTFLNDTIALVSSSNTPNSAVMQFFDLSSWPPVNIMNRTLSRQPKLYWYDRQYNQLQPTPTISTTSADVSPTSATDGRQEGDGLSGGAIAGIVVGACVITFLSLVAVIAIGICYKRTRHQPQLESGRSRQQMVTGGLGAVEVKPVQATTK